MIFGIMLFLALLKMKPGNRLKRIVDKKSLLVENTYSFHPFGGREK